MWRRLIKNAPELRRLRTRTQNEPRCACRNCQWLQMDKWPCLLWLESRHESCRILLFPNQQSMKSKWRQQCGGKSRCWPATADIRFGLMSAKRRLFTGKIGNSGNLIQISNPQVTESRHSVFFRQKVSQHLSMALILHFFTPIHPLNKAVIIPLWQAEHRGKEGNGRADGKAVRDFLSSYNAKVILLLWDDKEEEASKEVGEEGHGERKEERRKWEDRNWRASWVDQSVSIHSPLLSEIKS